MAKIVGSINPSGLGLSFTPKDVDSMDINNQTFNIGDMVTFKLSKTASWKKGYFTGEVISFPKGFVKINSNGFEKKFGLPTVKVTPQCIRINAAIANKKRESFLGGIKEIQELKRIKQQRRNKKVKKDYTKGLTLAS